MQTEPLGYVEFEGRRLKVTPMNDVFLNHMFYNKKHWEILRLIINISLKRYMRLVEETQVTTVDGEIDVSTQYLNILSNKKVRKQDMKVSEKRTRNVKYIEFQNRANLATKAKPLLSVHSRAFEYFGLGISKDGTQDTQQIWLMAEDAPEVMHDELMINYILMDEVANRPYPNHSGIMFCSLPKLSKERSEAGDLARFLLGMIKESKYKRVQKIIEAFNDNFAEFKEDKEMLKVMSREEYIRLEAEAMLFESEAKGLAAGEIKGKIQILLTELNLSAAQIAEKLGLPIVKVESIIDDLGIV